MTITIRLALLVAAFVLFALATAGVNHPRFNCTAAGLACLALAMMAEGWR